MRTYHTATAVLFVLSVVFFVIQWETKKGVSQWITPLIH